MKKIFLIPLLTLLCTVMAWGNVAKIGNTEYATVMQAIAAAPNGVETQIDLIADVVEQLITVPAGKNIVLNLNSHSLTSDYNDDGEGFDENSAICNKGTLKVISEGNGIVAAPVTPNSCGFAIINYGDLVVEGGVFIGVNTPDWGGFGYFTNAVIYGSGAGNNITINGGTYILAQNPGIIWQGLLTTGGGHLTINGGRFSSAQVGTNGNISSYLGNGCTMEQVAFSESYASWVSSVYLVTSAASSGVTYDVNGAEINEDVETTDVLVKAGVTVTLKKDHKITCDNLAFEDETAQLIIEAGAAVIVNDEVTAASVDNIKMTMDGRDNGDGNSYLLIKAGQIQDSHPLATVVLKSKAYLISENPDRYAFQRFAVPTYLGGFRRDSLVYNHEAARTAIYRWDYSANKWQSMANSDEFEPFQCYDMTTLATTAGQEYTFKVRLVGNGNAELPLQGRWNYFANSYTAPIDIAPVIRYLYDGYQGDVSSSVYVHHANGNYWDVINVAQVIRDNLLQTTIEPMQAFVLERINPEASNPSIDYTSHVYNPFMGIKTNNAPRRNTPVQLDFTFATMNVEAADGSRNTMEMYEGNQFDASFDNGFDVAKFMNEDCFNMYFVAQEGNMAYLASDNVANTAITLDTKEATSYTINFADVTMEGYALRDNLTGTETEIVSGNTYSFSAPANSKIEGRFEIVAIAKMPTAIENTEVKANKKGIYTLTGQYLGENFHVLPAGVYVINGKKVVK